MLRYVNTASTAGGDGTTNATSGANRAYASLAAWEAAEQADLTSLTEIAEVRCCGTAADTTAVSVDGWTTSASYYIWIRGNEGDAAGRHEGRWSTSHYRMEVSIDGDVLRLEEAYTRVTGIQVYNTLALTGDWNPVGLIAPAASCVIDAVIARGTPNAADYIRSGIAIGANGIVRNSIAFDWRNTATNRGEGFARIGFTAQAQNCTAYNCHAGYSTPDEGASAAQQLIVRNCVAAGCASGFLAGWTFGTGSDYNASDDATPPGANSLSNVADFDFADAAGFDFSLGASSPLIDEGTDLSSDFTTDIAGQTRTGTWDIGAWEYQSGGGGGRAMPLAGLGGGLVGSRRGLAR